MSPSVEVKTLTIDGQQVSARAGQTILEVAREHDIDIPTLCHLDGLSDVGACRLCLVEIKGSNKLFPACVTTVYEGMEVTTVTERLQKHRKTILELLFAERNHICSVCVSNGHCELQTLAQQQGITHVRLPYRNPALHRRCLARALHPRSQPLHPLHPLRARLRRDRRRPCLGCDGPRHRLHGHYRPAPAVGRVRLHALRKMCAGLPHRALFDKSKSARTTPSIPTFCPT